MSIDQGTPGVKPEPANGRVKAPTTGTAGRSLKDCTTPRDTFVALLARGFWPVATHPEEKRPIGTAWGAKRWTLADGAGVFNRNKKAGVGVCLGPGRAPDDGWLGDVEGDGPEAEESRAKLFGGEDIKTMGWGSARGGHQLIRCDGNRLAAIVGRLKPFQVKDAGTHPGVFHIPALPGLELRLGGFKSTGKVKQVQSIVPPTVGTNGKAREWNGVETVADAPDSFYLALEAIADEAEAQAKAGREKLAEPIPEPFAVPKEKTSTTSNVADAYLKSALVKSAGRIESKGEGERRDTYRNEAYSLAGWLHYNERFGIGYSERELADTLKSALAIGVSSGDPVVETTVNEAIAAGKLAPRELKADLHLAAIGARRSGAESPNGNSSAGSAGSIPGDIQKNGSPDGRSVGFVGGSTQEYPEFEGPPRPLTMDLLPVLPLPPRLIPDAFRPWLTDIAKRGCFPLEYPTASALVGLSSLIGRSLTIRPKRHDSWTVVPNLWGMIVGPPGLQKTPAAEETLLPLKRLVAEAIEAFAAAQTRALGDAAVAEAKAGAAKKKLAEAAKKGLPDSVLRQLADEANASAEVAEVTVKRYIVNDATVEKLGELLRENPRCLFQYRDELSGFFRAMDRQGHESDRGFYLEAWNGNGSYTFDRIGRGTVHVNALCLSIFGTIQPGPLSRYLKGAASGEDADGFVPRFQILLYPDVPARFVNVDQWPDTEAKNRAFEVFRWIDGMNAAELGAELDEDRGLRFIRFDDEAQALFDEWRVALENRIRSGSEGTLLTCHLSKYRSLMPSLALLFHIIDSVGTRRLDPVTKLAAVQAAAWCELLESHARRVYQSATEGDIEAAVRLAERIKQSLPNPFTFRQVAGKGWTGLDNVDDVRKAVGILEDRDWAKVVVSPSGPNGGRPSEKVWVNPALHKEGVL